jgi:hypothetical protein
VNIRDIGHTEAIWAIGTEVSVHQIRCTLRTRLAYGGANAFPSADALQACRSRTVPVILRDQAGDSLLADPYAFVL